MIFETERLIVRKLNMNDLQSFHELQRNPKVLQFADGEIKSLAGNEEELEELILKYTKENNDFWIYAISRKSDSSFLGTLALVKDGEDDEIGYRFLEREWGKGYGAEICKGLINYCKQIGLKKIIGYVADANIASVRILEQNNFEVVSKQKDANGIDETKFEFKL